LRRRNYGGISSKDAYALYITLRQPAPEASANGSTATVGRIMVHFVSNLPKLLYVDPGACFTYKIRELVASRSSRAVGHLEEL
jgi:hypothetical protein